MGASVLPIRFELRQIAGGREGPVHCRRGNTEVQAGLCQQSRQSPEADCSERETDVSLVFCLCVMILTSLVFSIFLRLVCLVVIYCMSVIVEKKCNLTQVHKMDRYLKFDTLYRSICTNHPLMTIFVVLGRRTMNGGY